MLAEEYLVEQNERVQMLLRFKLETLVDLIIILHNTNNKSYACFSRWLLNSNIEVVKVATMPHHMSGKYTSK